MYVQRTTAKNKMATKVLGKCMGLSCFYDKFPWQKSSNFLKNGKFKVCGRFVWKIGLEIVYFLKFTVSSFTELEGHLATAILRNRRVQCLYGNLRANLFLKN